MKKAFLRATSNWCLVLLYYFMAVVSHVKVGGWINGLFKDLSRPAYNNIISIIVITMVLVGSFGIYRAQKSKPLPRLVILLICYTALAIILSFGFFFVIHIEAIHFLQYGILAFLIKRLMTSYFAVALITMLAGAYDELFQYLVLDTRATYFDFNDIFLDAVGGGIGLLVYWFINPKQAEPVVYNKKIWWKRPEWLAVGVSAVLVLIAALIGEFRINPVLEDPALFILFKERPEGFWYYPTGPYARYHILRPIPGLMLIGVTVYIYGLLDRVAIET